VEAAAERLAGAGKELERAVDPEVLLVPRCRKGGLACCGACGVGSGVGWAPAAEAVGSNAGGCCGGAVVLGGRSRWLDSSPCCPQREAEQERI